MKEKFINTAVFKVTLLGVLVPLYSLGGTELGNGGDAIVCSTQSGRAPAEILDYYEGREWHNHIHSFSTTGDFLARADHLLDRLATFDPDLASAFKQRVRSIYADFNLRPNIELENIPDSQHIGIPTSCLLKQVVIRLSEVQLGQKRFQVSKDIWDLLDDNNRAGLLLHEVIYEYLTGTLKVDLVPIQRDPRYPGFPHGNSSYARRFNSLIGSLGFDQLTAVQYATLQKEIVGAATLAIDGRRYENGRPESAWWPLEFFESGTVRSGKLFRSSSFITNYGIVESADDSTLEFHENGKLKALNRVKHPSKIAVKDRVFDIGFYFSEDVLTFSNEGILLKAVLGRTDDPYTWSETPLIEVYSHHSECLTVNDQCHPPQINGPATFAADGTLLNATIRSETGFQLESEGGSSLSFEVSYPYQYRFFRVQFDPQGYIIGGFEID